MDNLKFRAWDKNTERMWDIETWHIVDEYVDLIEPGKSIADINAERVWRKQSEIILMQFTGLKDVNGKEIYIGDIVKYRNLDEKYQYLKIRWLQQDCMIDAGGYRIDIVARRCEVIGNVHTNPELLEE